MARILLVEDDADFRGALERYLSKVGHDVRAVGGGQAALAALEAGPTDLIVTDLFMPEVDGLQLVNELRKSQSVVPVIAISGGGRFTKEMMLQTAKALGAAVTLQKPFDLDELGQAVERVLIGR